MFRIHEEILIEHDMRIAHALFGMAVLTFMDRKRLWVISAIFSLRYI